MLCFMNIKRKQTKSEQLLGPVTDNEFRIYLPDNLKCFI